MVLVWGVVIYNLIVINLSLEVTFRQMVFGMEEGGSGFGIGVNHVGGVMFMVRVLTNVCSILSFQLADNIEI